MSWASIETRIGRRNARRLPDLDPDDPALRPLRLRDGREGDAPPLAAAQEGDAERGADRLAAEIACRSSTVRTTLPSIATITSSGSSLPFAGKPGSIASTCAPFSIVVTFLPSVRSATAAAICCDCRISSRLACLLLRVALARRHHGLPGGTRSAPELKIGAAEELLEQRRPPDHDVDEVDPASVLGLVAAGDVDERRDGVSTVGQEDVVA